MSNKCPKNFKESFVNHTYPFLNENNKFKFWQIIFPIIDEFKLKEFSEEFAKSLSVVNSDEKFEKIFAIINSRNAPISFKTAIINQIYQQLSDEYKLNFWLDGLIDYVNTEYLKSMLYLFVSEKNENPLLEKAFNKLSGIQKGEIISFILNTENSEYIDNLTKFIFGIIFNNSAYSKYSYNWSSFGEGAIKSVTITNKNAIKEIFFFPTKLLEIIWTDCLKKCYADFHLLIKERNIKIHIIYKYAEEHIELCFSNTSSVNYDLIIMFLNSFNSAMNEALKSFSSKQTIKLRKELINSNVIKPLFNYIYEQLNNELRLRFALEGYINQLDIEWITNNLSNISEQTLIEILKFRNSELNRKIISYLVDQYSDLNKDNEYSNAQNLIKLIDSFTPELKIEFLSKIQQLTSLLPKVKLWIEGYFESVKIDDLLQCFYLFEYEQDAILMNCKIEEQKVLLHNLLTNIGKVENDSEYENLKAILQKYRKIAPYTYENSDWLSYIQINKEYLLKLWIDGFESNISLDIAIELSSKINGIVCIDEIKYDIIRERINNIGVVDSEKSYTLLNELLTFVKNNTSEEFYNPIFSNVYKNKSDYCKIKMYINDFVDLSNEKAQIDFQRIFSGQYFKLLKSEKTVFLRKAKKQLPDFNEKILKNINIGNRLQINEDGISVYQVYYNDIYFNNGFFSIKIFDKNGEETFCKPHEWYFSKVTFNLLQSFFSAKQQKQYLRVTIDNRNNILSTPELVDDLTELEKNILVIILQNKSNSDVIKEIDKTIKPKEYETLSNTDIKRITNEKNSECVQYLFENITEAYKPIYVAEILNTGNSISAHIGSWLFYLPLNNDEFVIIWESIELGRATHLFKTTKNKFDEILKEIQIYLFSPSENKREKLNSNNSEDTELQSKLNHWLRVDHDHNNKCKKWYSTMQELIPSLQNRELRHN